MFYKQIRNLFSKNNQSEIIKKIPEIIRLYNLKLYHRDSLGIVSVLIPENLPYIIQTGSSVDALPMMKALDKKINKNEVCFDVGANVGVTTVWMARKSKYVYAFEPETKNLEMLEENLSLNFVNNVKILPLAVSSKKGKATLHTFQGYGHHSLANVQPNTKRGEEIVECVTIDDFCKKNNVKKIDFLKVDVEGFELEVFIGAEEMMKNRKIERIAFEISRIPLVARNRNAFEVIEFLRTHNFEVKRLNGEVVTDEYISEIEFEDLWAELKK